LHQSIPTAPSLCGGSAGSIPARFGGERRARKQLFCEPSGPPENLRKLRVHHVRLVSSGRGFGHVGTMDGEDCTGLGLTCRGLHHAYRHRTCPHSRVQSMHRPRHGAGRSAVRRRPRTHAHGHQPSSAHVCVAPLPARAHAVASAPSETAAEAPSRTPQIGRRRHAAAERHDDRQTPAPARHGSLQHPCRPPSRLVHHWRGAGDMVAGSRPRSAPSKARRLQHAQLVARARDVGGGDALHGDGHARSPDAWLRRKSGARHLWRHPLWRRPLWRRPLRRLPLRRRPLSPLRWRRLWRRPARRRRTARRRPPR